MQRAKEAVLVILGKPHWRCLMIRKKTVEFDRVGSYKVQSWFLKMSLFFLIPDNVNQTLLSFASQTVTFPSLKPPNNSILNK